MLTDDQVSMLLRHAAEHARSGRLEQAIATYERLLAQRPGLPDSWYNLAWLQRQAGHYEAALASYRQALDSGVAQPEEVHLNRSVIYADGLRRSDEAERELHAALTLAPRYTPALQNLANLHEDRGRRAEALVTYERLLAIEPAAHEALARYAALRGAVGRDDPLLARLRRAIDAPATALDAKASLGFALGKLLDDCQAYDEAFEAYTAANRHSRASVGSAGPLYDRRAHERLIDHLIATFAPPTEAAPIAVEPPPIFICGMFRSGSTLAEQLLASHPEVCAGGELDLLSNLVHRSLGGDATAVTRLGPDALASIAQRYRQMLRQLAPDGRRVTDKRPDNFLHIGLIKTLFPNARIVHTTRHVLDNALSIYFLHIDPSMGYAFDLGDIGHYIVQYRRLMAHWKSRYGADILDFDYDALVREPRPAVERLLAFCDLPWDDVCLSFPHVANAVRTASVWQVRQPIYRHASGRWRHYERHLGPLLGTLGDAAEAGR